VIASQLGIALFGVTAVYLSQDKRQSRARFACLFGLAGQPFWIVETYTHQQWGILALTVLYTWSWARGVRTHWLKPKAVA
jgi:hypothetical protein